MALTFFVITFVITFVTFVYFTYITLLTFVIPLYQVFLEGWEIYDVA